MRESEPWWAEPNHQEFVNDLLSDAPESWGDDVAAEAIALAYVRELERRVVALGGSLERWPDDA
jgi:hypothetical protein